MQKFFSIIYALQTEKKLRSYEVPKTFYYKVDF